jgi:hypothetical protein
VRLFASGVCKLRSRSAAWTGNVIQKFTLNYPMSFRSIISSHTHVSPNEIIEGLGGTAMMARVLENIQGGLQLNPKR